MKSDAGKRISGAVRQMLSRTVVVIPAFNESECVRAVLDDVRASLPGADVALIDDGSSDDTASLAESLGAKVLRMPYNGGVGPATQTGFRYALERGYDYALRIDGDGQHPPIEAVKLFEKMAETGADVVIGTRYGEGTKYVGSWLRRIELGVLARFESMICRKRITDPTSGFWLLTRPLMRCFDIHYPSDYPEPEAIALLRRQGFSIDEVPVAFKPRLAGKSSLRIWGSINFALKVFLALFVDRLRNVNPHGSARHVKPGREIAPEGKGGAE